MVAATMSVSSGVAGNTRFGFNNLLQKAKGKCVNGGLQCIMCIPEFAKVPAAFSLKYNRSAQKISGLNWTSGGLEILKSLPKAAQWLIVPALIGGAACGLGPIAATLATALCWVAPMKFSEWLEELAPHEEESVRLACLEKGIDITKDNGSTNVNETGALYA